MRQSGMRDEPELVVVWRVTERCNLGCAFCEYSRSLTRSRRSANPAQVLAFGAVLRDYAETKPCRVLVSWLGGEPLTRAQTEALMQGTGPGVRRRLGLSLLSCWLLADPWFQGQGMPADAAISFLSDGLAELAELTSAATAVGDADRREELARLCLQSLGLRPAGESEAQAADRLSTLSSAERARVVKAAREAELRARKIREEIARKKAAEEADAKAIRE